MSSVNVPNVPDDPYNEIEFDVFLKEIGNANIKNWSIMAEGLGVSRKTIQRWRKHPLAKDAVSTAIAENLQEMTQKGKDDWRMNREKLKMLGIKDTTTLEHEIGESVTEVLDKLETNYEAIGQQASRQMVATESPVQDKG